MIDYMYSRIIVTIASIALVGIVVSASYGATEQAARMSAEQVANDICEIVEKARRIEGDYFRQSIPLSDDISIKINVTHFEVEKGRYSASRAFDQPVIVMLAGKRVNSTVANDGSIISISASRGVFDKENSVTIAVIGKT